MSRVLRIGASQHPALIRAYIVDGGWERPLTTTDPLGSWTMRYETVRGVPDTLATPMGDTVTYFFDHLGRLEDRSVRHDDTLRVQSQTLYKWNQTEGSSANFVYSALGYYLAGSFGRAIKDTSALALSPSWVEQLGVGTPRDTLRDSTAYDSWGRLTRWAPMRGTSPDGPGESYSYDRGGNLRVAGETLVIDPVTERLTSRTVGGVTTSYTYDRSGNLVTRASGSVTWSYGYDPLDRLVSVRRNSVLIARYGYDVLGRRIVKRVYSSASGGTVGYTRFVYKGSHVSFETDSAGTMGLRYTWGAGTDDLVAITTAAGQHYYVTTDKLGSVRSIAKRDGTWQLSQRFDPYGRLIVRDSASGSTIGAQLRYGWTGREWDEETGFSYHRARYFDPESRRWTQEDPIGYAGGMNVYAYVGGSPMESRDPSGAIPSGGGATHASRLWHAAHAEDPWLEHVAGRPEEYYNLFLSVFTGWQERVTLPGAPDLSYLRGIVAEEQPIACPPLCDHLDPTRDNFFTYREAGPTITAGAFLAVGFLALGPRALSALGFISEAAPPARLLLPAAGSAMAKLQALGNKFGVSPVELANRAISSGTRMVDNLERNAGNINAIIARPDGASGFIRVTLDPTASRIVSAGYQSANMVWNGIATGRFTLIP